MNTQPRQRRTTRRPGRLWVSGEDVVDVLEIVEHVYENVHLLADEGIVAFDTLDLRPALAILQELVGDVPQ